ncbi:MAG: hypothetical protein JXR83_06925 [Deltaproteobacteria bacterium]|nr:hypothetical protein [Deltaproteobacteria bacterium]
MRCGTPSAREDWRRRLSALGRSPRAIAALWGGALSALVVAIHGPLIARDPILQQWDDVDLLRPLRDLPSLAAYRLHLTPDLQPLRDLSFYADIAVSRVLGVSIFHLHNVALWLAILAVVGSLLAELSLDRAERRWTVALLAVHPVFVNTVGWIAARKHLLAALFILLATLLLLRQLQREASWRRGLALPVLFACALLAQPIGVLWPLWGGLAAVVHRRWRAPAVAVPLAICGALAVAGAALNLHYYLGRYHTLEGNAPKTLPLVDNLALIPQMYGRYFLDLTFPFELAAVYRAFSVGNLVGAVLFVVWVFLVVRLLAPRIALLGLAFFLFPLAVVTFNVTPLFVSDTYLLLPAFAAALLTQQLVRRARERWNPPRLLAQTVAAVVLVALAAGAALQARAWRGDVDLWRQAYQRERDPSSIEKYASVLLAVEGAAFDPVAARELIYELATWDDPRKKPAVFGLASRWLLRVRRDSARDRASRIELIRDFAFPHSLKQRLLGELLFEQLDFGAAYQAFLDGLGLVAGDPGRVAAVEEIAAYLDLLGERTGESRHASFVATARARAGWDEESYRSARARLAELAAATP